LIEELFAEIPPDLRWSKPLRLPPPLAESELTARLHELAAPNTHLDEAVCFLGGGTYDHYVPAVVDAIAQAVGPLLVVPGAPQPVLQVVFELQTLFASLSGLDAAAAPFASGPMAFARAIRMAAQVTGRSEVVVARSANPGYRAIARTMLEGPSLEIREAGYHGGATRPDEAERILSGQTACLAVEHPNFFGCLEQLPALAAAARRHGALFIVKADAISLGVLAPPGEAGADIAVADAQSLGSRPAYGSASLGLLACRSELAGKLPSWRVERDGETFRAAGEFGQALRADRIVRPVAYLAALGAGGLERAAIRCAGLAHELQRRLCSVEGFDPRFRAPFFKEFVVESAFDPEDVAEALLESNVLGALPLQPFYPEMNHCMLFAATERRTKSDIDMLHHALELLADTAVELG